MPMLLAMALTGCLAVPRPPFIQEVDRALASRDRKAIEAVVDWDVWRAAGRPDPKDLELVLPPAPLKRLRALTEREYVYGDGQGREWRLRLVEMGGRLRVLALERACPPGGMRRGPIGDDAPAAAPPPAAPPAATFTPLECWPLPR